jgi:hypothetical protein
MIYLATVTVRAPLLIYLATVAEGLPFVALAAPRRLRGARAWVLLWCAVLLGVDLLAMWLGRHRERNLWLGNVIAPAGGALALWALSCWQARELPRLTLRFAIVPFLLAWLVLLLAVDNVADFSRVAWPMANLVCLCAAAFTLLVRSHAASGSLVRQDWFWVSAGMALYFGVSVTIAPLSALLVGDDPRQLALAYEARAALEVVAFLLIAVGMVCPSET